ncbi:MAG TPA: glucose-6-phosphate dehydrogenase assembly protein OpcA [Mycobacteriales bacterium]|nr:glucose-6-phosphate dehydrogenase assembly protein OpcA [Mycobacteriales bacterium]
MTTLWDTSGTQVVKALAVERRHSGAVSSGLALTLVSVVDEALVAEAEQAATAAAAQHPCRLLLVVRHRVDAPAPRLDAEVSVGGRLGPGEVVVMRMYGRLALHAESVVLPLLAADAPVVTWWYGPPPDRIATDPLGVLADRRITDCRTAADPLAALRTRAEDYAPGDTDLAWTRTTLWRGLCASAFDSLTGEVESLRVSGEASNPSRALLAGWLTARLGIGVTLEDTSGPGVTGVELGVGGTSVSLTRTDGRTAVVRRPGQPDRSLPLPRRELSDLLAEDLRRLDADDTYAEALQEATGTSGLPERPKQRVHEWRDPAETGAP